MTSAPTVQIAYALLAADRAADRVELRRQAHELAQLLDWREVCLACWKMASNGTAGKVQHQPDTLCVWGE